MLTKIGSCTNLFSYQCRQGTYLAALASSELEDQNLIFGQDLLSPSADGVMVFIREICIKDD